MQRMQGTKPSSIIWRVENIKNSPLISFFKYKIFLKLNKYQGWTAILKIRGFREVA